MAAPPDAAARRYALRHAIAHRIEATDWTSVGQLACDFGFLEAKCCELGVHDVEADMTRAAERSHTGGGGPIGRDLGDLSRALARESHWLRNEPAALAGQLWNRLRRITDDAARSFAVGFYRALGNRRSGHAVDHAVATLAAKQYPDEDLPRCRTRDGIDAHQLVLTAQTAGSR